ncbi:hypothetical protein [Nocardioides dongxiaopingii]|uniref:hypothetical protein n=1 Tax=Nocardioides dongxiaopingii TaxID=2576036 RepID=UPI0010C76615|nr:hypothetical protein [Nocardioides dongxiaopingii]
MHPRHLAAPLAALALALCLGACTDDPEPKVEDPPSSTPSVDPVTSAPPTSEPTSEPPSDETPEEFIRRFQAASFDMQSSGDSGPYRALTQNCRSCDNLADSVDGVYADGGTVEISPGSVHNLQILSRRKGTLVIEYDLRIGPTVIFDRDGEVTQEFAGGVSQFQLNIRRQEGTWRVLRINTLAQR